MRERLDASLVRRGLVTSRAEAALAIEEGLVRVSGSPAMKPAMMVDRGAPVVLAPGSRRFVSRGGDKLAEALIRFEIDVEGRRCLDAGASTGGFSDCLLRNGAAAVVAVDVGYGQLAWSLRSDPRVTVLDRTNVRNLTPDELPFTPDLLTADLSFISLRSVLGPLAALGAPGADYVLLVKPQFEAERADIDRGGVVRDPNVWLRSLADVADAGEAAGLSLSALAASPLVGPAGNVEFLAHARKAADGSRTDVEQRDDMIGRAVDEGRSMRRAS